MKVFTVIGYLRRGTNHGSSILEYVEASSPNDAYVIINDWYERNAKVIAVIEGRVGVFRPENGPVVGPIYTDKAKSISHKRKMEMVARMVHELVEEERA